MVVQALGEVEGRLAKAVLEAPRSGDGGTEDGGAGHGVPPLLLIIVLFEDVVELAGLHGVVLDVVEGDPLLAGRLGEEGDLPDVHSPGSGH